MTADQENREKPAEEPDTPPGEPESSTQEPEAAAEGSQTAAAVDHEDSTPESEMPAQEAPITAEEDASSPEAGESSEQAGEPAHAVPAGDAREIAGVVEDAPLEAIQEAAEAEQSSPEEAGDEAPEEDIEEPAPRVKPSVPGAHLEVDIVPEGVDPLGRAETYEDPYAIEEEDAESTDAGEDGGEQEEILTEPIATAAIDLAAGARYRATGKRKTAIARVTLRPGSGTYLVNGRSLEAHFPRTTLQRNIRQPLETVGYQERMDVVARLHGGGISAQAGALRHGVSRALLEADPNLRGELKRRGFLTRDSRAKERKKAGLKKARKRPQFSKR